MKRLHDKVNVIPVIAKSDTMTPEEVTHFKRQILNQIRQANIRLVVFENILNASIKMAFFRIYEFPEEELVNGIESEQDRKENRLMKDRVPFAIVGSNCLIENADGKKVRGRRYPWGVVDVSFDGKS